MNNLSHNLSGIAVNQRAIDGYVNATALTTAHKQATGQRKDVADWLKAKRTQETLEHLSSITTIPVNELYQVFQGSSENGGGTWLHPKLSVRFATWLSDDFGFQVESWVEQWMTTAQNPIAQQHSKLHLAPFWYQRLVLFRAQNKVQPGYFSIFQETIELIGDLETAGYQIPDSAIPDISIGLCWAKHLRSEGIEPNEVAVTYPHQYPDGRKVEANSYSEDMLPKFRRWFRETYKPVKLPAYLGNKDKTSLPALSKMLDIPIALLK